MFEPTSLSSPNDDGLQPLMRAMIAGISADPPWQEFVHCLRRAFDAEHANIIFRHPALELNFMTSSSSAAVANIGNPQAEYVSADDPITYFEMTPFKAYRVAEFVGVTEPASHRFIAEFLERFHMGSVLVCRVATKTGLQAWISVARELDRGFEAEAVDKLQAIARIFDEALVIFGRVKEIEDQRDDYERVARAGATGVVRIDARGVVLHMDDNSRAWTGGGGVLEVWGERLRATQEFDRGRFDKSLSNILEGKSDEELITLETSEGEGVELLMFPTSDQFEPARTNAPRAILYMRATSREQSPSLERMHVLFGLSRREAMLAVLLVRGLTTAEAARDLGISGQTARTYLRQVFEKTGVTRQAELVRKIHASIASVR